MSHDNGATAVDFKRLVGPGAVLAILGLGGLGFVLTQDRELFFQSYLFGYVFWVCLTLGCFGLTILHHTVRGSWGLAVLRLYEAGGGPTMLALFGVLVAPIVLGMHDLYHWTHAEAVKNDIVLQHKAPYLNETFWVIRVVAFFLILVLVASVLRSSSLRQDKNFDPNEQSKRTNISAPMLVVFVIGVTFFVTDLVMSLDPHWFSTIYGIWFVVGQGLAALSLGTFIVCRFAKAKPYCDIVSPALTRDLGNMMFAFTMLWAYFTLSQFLITWSGNLPEFTTYYYNRGSKPGTEAWNYLGAFNVVCQFFIPWTLLLSPRVKRTLPWLMALAAWIFLMRVSDLYWNVIPYFGRSFHWADLAAFVGLGGVWMAVFGTLASREALVPAHDTRLQEALHHEHA